MDFLGKLLRHQDARLTVSADTPGELIGTLEITVRGDVYTFKEQRMDLEGLMGALENKFVQGDWGR